MEKVSGVMVKTTSQKSSEGQKAMLEVEIKPDPTLEENWTGPGLEGNGDRRLTRFCHIHGTLHREEMSELSDISTEIVATRRSPSDNTMMHGVTEKTATSSSFSVQVENSLVNFFP